MELKKLMEHISIIPDYRQAWKVEHKLSDILLLTICAVISGAEGWEDIEDFGETHPDSTMHSLVLGQIKTDEKSNEITAIPELLNMMDIKGKIITTDAMGCQKDIAEKIQKQGGDYLFAVKGNQGRLNKAFEEKFPLKELNNPEHDSYATAIRNHWHVENKLHWRLDVVMNEDDCKIRRGNAAELFSGIRHIAINILTNDKVFKAGLRRKMRKAAMDRNYLASVLAGSGLS
ncbi:ISAs1 family transposase [Escherichia coli]|uniref:ISAs1 family transposase n=1 Tax=Escherichia coli TaxID=562 RepID=UPI0039874329